MGVGLNSALGLVGTLGVAANKASEAIGAIGGAGGNGEGAATNTQNTGNDSYVPVNQNYDSLDKDVLKNFANYSDTPISQANDGELSMQMADKAMNNMSKALQAKRATRARIKGGKR